MAKTDTTFDKRTAHVFVAARKSNGDLRHESTKSRHLGACVLLRDLLHPDYWAARSVLCLRDHPAAIPGASKKCRLAGGGPRRRTRIPGRGVLAFLRAMAPPRSVGGARDRCVRHNLDRPGAVRVHV